MSGASDVQIRPAQEDEVPLLLTLIRELAAYEQLVDEVVATEERLRETLFGPDRAAEAVLALDGEEPVGFAVFYQNYSTFLARPGLYLEDIYVRPDARGRGVGRRLMSHLARLARERGCGRMEWAVLDWNDLAIDFYDRIGAQAMDDWTTYRVTGAALDRLASGDQRSSADSRGSRRQNR